MPEQTDLQTLLQIYDPAMCCSTGVCGTDVDDNLVRFANDVKWLKGKGIAVERYNLGQEPEKFKDNPEVLKLLQEKGSDILPIIVVNGKIVSQAAYPDRIQFDLWIGKQATDSKTNGQVKSQAVYNPKVEMLVALGSAMAIGSKESMEACYNRCKELGIPEADISKALQTALNIQQADMQVTVNKANELLGIKPQGCCTPNSGCC